MKLKQILEVLDGEDYRFFLRAVISAVESAQDAISEDDRRTFPDEYALKVGEFLDEEADDQDEEVEDEGPTANFCPQCDNRIPSTSTLCPECGDDL